MPWPTQKEVEDAFVRWLCERGIPPAESERLFLDGRKRRYRVAGDRGAAQNGEYAVFCDERPAGWAKSWSAKHAAEYESWVYFQPGESPWTPEERREYAKRMEAQREAAARQREMDRARASAEAARKWEAATEPRADRLHPYLRKKGLSGPHGARLLGNLLVLPVLNASGDVMNVQTIAADGEKRFHPGAPKGGGFFVLGGSAEPPEGGREVFLCEGFATGASVHEATGRPVIVAWDCGNLPKVAEALRERYPGRLVLAADNDRRTPGNPGMAAAFGLAEEFGIPFAAPRFEDGEDGSDWNDYAALHGIERTAEDIFLQLEETRKAPELAKHFARPRWVRERKSGGPLGTIENLEALLEFSKISVWYNEIKKDVDFALPKGWDEARFGRDNRENALFALILSLCVNHSYPTTNLDAFLGAIAAARRQNPVARWIKSRAWDGRDRVGPLCETLTLASWFPEDLKKMLISRWLVSAVAACVSDKEFKTRGVLVLQGAQAIGKTSWFASLLPQDSGWFLDGVALDPEDKDSLKKVISHWIVELGELEATFKKADINKLKSFITSPTDVVRLPWARKLSNFPRRTVFCASVNQAEFLVDTTGNSRWWCLPCKSIDYKHGIDAQQLWAQVFSLYSQAPVWWLGREEEERLNEICRYFEAGDEIEDLLSDSLDWEEYEEPGGFGAWKNATSVLRACGLQNPSKTQVRRAGEVLRKLTGRDPERRGKARDRCYWVPNKKTFL